MNKTLSTTLTVIAVVVLAAVIFFAGSMYARMNAYGSSMMFGWNNDNAFLPNNMMNGRGPTMMGGYAPGGMMNGRGPTMMNGYGYNNANPTPLTADQVKSTAEKYLANLNNSDLEIAEIMIFNNNAYVVVKETSTGNGAFELLVDATSQVAYPEYGPNMMWNLKYSGLNHNNMMGGYGNMMQGWNSTTPLDVSTEMTVTPKQAVEYAQKYLDAIITGATTEHPMPFYGYYTLDFEKDGKVAGMLSVNGFSGQVFLHTWHGTFIEETEYE